MQGAWQVEPDRYARSVLERHWPGRDRFGDIRELFKHTLFPECPTVVDVLSGGDPCPSRSRARGNTPSLHPDLAGYFLAVVGRLRPRWVVRENVPAPDVVDFICGLELLGYRTAAIELNSADFTAQNRWRQFIVGCACEDGARAFRRCLSDGAHDPVDDRAEDQTPQVTECLTAHPRRLAEDTICYEPDHGLRSLTAEEREALQGFPRGWTAGLSWTRRCILLGRAVTVPVAEWIGKRICTTERRHVE